MARNKSKHRRTSLTRASSLIHSAMMSRAPDKASCVACLSVCVCVRDSMRVFGVQARERERNGEGKDHVEGKQNRQTLHLDQTQKMTNQDLTSTLATGVTGANRPLFLPGFASRCGRGCSVVPCGAAAAAASPGVAFLGLAFTGASAVSLDVGVTGAAKERQHRRKRERAVNES